MLDRRLEIMLSLLWCNNASSITCCYERDGLDAEVQCPSCGYKFNPVEKQAKHPSRLTAKITEEMIADEDETDSIWMKIQDNMEMRKRRTITL